MELWIWRCLSLVDISKQSYTGGNEFRDRILFVVTSTEPVLERSYAIELGGILGNMACITWSVSNSEFGWYYFNHCWSYLTTCWRSSLTTCCGAAGSTRSISWTSEISIWKNSNHHHHEKHSTFKSQYLNRDQIVPSFMAVAITSQQTDRCLEYLQTRLAKANRMTTRCLWNGISWSRSDHPWFSENWLFLRSNFRGALMKTLETEGGTGFQT